MDFKTKRLEQVARHQSTLKDKVMKIIAPRLRFIVYMASRLLKSSTKTHK